MKLSVIKWQQGSDYINANYLDVSREREEGREREREGEEREREREGGGREEGRERKESEREREREGGRESVFVAKVITTQISYGTMFAYAICPNMCLIKKAQYKYIKGQQLNMLTDIIMRLYYKRITLRPIHYDHCITISM